MIFINTLKNLIQIQLIIRIMKSKIRISDLVNLIMGQSMLISVRKALAII